jgi:membrane protein YdbS with pleckstrin-like domain
MSIRSELLAFLRVPSAPSAPAGDQDVRIFRAAPNFFRYKMARWAFTNAAAVVGLFVGIGFLRAVPKPNLNAGLMMLLTVVEAIAVLGFIIQALWTLALLRLDYEQRWYLVSDRSLRIREGIVRMHEKTMTFANIQNVSIQQGPLQRILGIADLQVRTAGGGGGGGPREKGHTQQDDLHVAYFRGVDNAENISETIRERLRRHADSGLGDPDDAYHTALPGSAGHHSLLAAARALADEARALRGGTDLLSMFHDGPR